MNECVQKPSTSYIESYKYKLCIYQKKNIEK